MKKLLICIMFLLIFTGTTGMGLQDEFWFCAQPGSIENTKVLLITPIHPNHTNWNHDKKVKEFNLLVKKRVGKKFIGQFEPYCLGYESRAHAEIHFKEVLKRAVHLGFQLFTIPLYGEK